MINCMEGDRNHCYGFHVLPDGASLRLCMHCGQAAKLINCKWVAVEEPKPQGG